MPRARNGDVSLYYEVSQPERAGDAETVVFVEGLGYGRWMWNFQHDRMREFRRIVWDNRGTGDSDSAGPGPILRRLPEWKNIRTLGIFALGGYSIADMAGDLEAVLREANVDSCHVVGASMGGMIAQEYAIEYDRAETVTLLCTSHGGEEAAEIPEETQQKMFSVPEGYDERESIKYKMRPAMTEDFFESNPELIDRIVDWRLEGDAADPERLAQGAAVTDFDSSNRLDRIEEPTLIAHGTADRVLPVENAHQLHEGIPDSELELFEDGPHLFFIEEADAVTERIRTFIRDHAGEGA